MYKKSLIIILIALLILPMATAEFYPAIDSDFIDASDYPNYPWAAVIKYTQQENIVIEGKTIHNAPYFGIFIKNCVNVTISNCSFYNIQSSAICIKYCDHVNVYNNTVIKSCMNKDQEGISLQDCNKFKVYNNTIIDCHKEGIDAKSGSNNGSIYNNIVVNSKDARPGIYVDAFEDNTINVTVAKNILLGTGQGISLATESGGSLKDIAVKFNYVIVDSNAFSIHRYNNPGSNKKENLLITNNLFISNEARSLHITDHPSNFLNLRILQNMNVGPTVWVP